MKKGVEFSLTFFGTVKYNCVIKTREMLSFLPLTNNSVTIGSTFLLLSIQQSYHQKSINILGFLFGLYYLIFL